MPDFLESDFLENDLVETYHRDGIAMIPAIVPEQDLCAAAHLIDAIRAGRHDLNPEIVSYAAIPSDNSVGANPTDDPDDETDKFVVIANVAAIQKKFLEILTAAPVIACVEAVAGDGLVYLFGNVTMKPARHGGAIPLHRDYAHAHLMPDFGRRVRAMVCLDGMTEENGATTYYPGSHRQGWVRHTAGALQQVICPPGSLVLIHPMVLHGGGPNNTAMDRRNLIGQWADTVEPALGDIREHLTGYTAAQIRDWLRQPGQWAFDQVDPAVFRRLV